MRYSHDTNCNKWLNSSVFFLQFFSFCVHLAQFIIFILINLSNEKCKTQIHIHHYGLRLVLPLNECIYIWIDPFINHHLPDSMWLLGLLVGLRAHKPYGSRYSSDLQNKTYFGLTPCSVLTHTQIHRNAYPGLPRKWSQWLGIRLKVQSCGLVNEEKLLIKYTKSSFRFL